MGGLLDTKKQARKIAEMGRGGDTMLAHINRREADVLKLLGGSGTVNPHTGLPEFMDGIGGIGGMSHAGSGGFHGGGVDGAGNPLGGYGGGAGYYGPVADPPASTGDGGVSEAGDDSSGESGETAPYGTNDVGSYKGYTTDDAVADVTGYANSGLIASPADAIAITRTGNLAEMRAMGPEMARVADNMAKSHVAKTSEGLIGNLFGASWAPAESVTSVHTKQGDLASDLASGYKDGNPETGQYDTTVRGYADKLRTPIGILAGLATAPITAGLGTVGGLLAGIGINSAINRTIGPSNHQVGSIGSILGASSLAANALGAPTVATLAQMGAMGARANAAVQSLAGDIGIQPTGTTAGYSQPDGQTGGGTASGLLTATGQVNPVSTSVSSPAQASGPYGNVYTSRYS